MGAVRFGINQTVIESVRLEAHCLASSVLMYINV